MTLQTPVRELDQDFEVAGAITKTWADEDGFRYIQGVVSGVDEDRDGERVSEDCIKSMVSQVRKGGVVATASHQQDWLTTFGEAVEAYHDDESGEMLGKVRLPPKGQDPVADKAWETVKKGSLGWSIGGKLQGAFFEKTDLGKRRKVLDRVALKHFCLTDRPAYGASFAEIVGKTFDGDPDDDEFVEKQAGPLGRPGADSATGDRNAGTKKKKAPAMNVDTAPDDDENDEDPDEDDDKEQKKPPELEHAVRHLACPNCGHEFAADLPDDRGEGSPDDEDDEDQDRMDEEDQSRLRNTRKTMEDDMPLKDTLAELRGLLDVEKEEPEEVEKVVTDEGYNSTVAKAVLETNDRLDALEGTLAEAFDLIAKSHKAMIETVKSQPLGRKSLARMPADGLPPAVGHGEEIVEKTIDEQIAESDGPVEALKVLNEHTYGIRAA